MERTRRLLQRLNSSLLGNSALRIQRAVSRISGRIPGGRPRLLVANLQPINPLWRESNLPTIEVLIPFIEKDRWLVKTVALAAVAASANPVGLVRLVTPDPRSKEVRKLVEEISDGLETSGQTNVRVVIESDESVLGSSLSQALNGNPELSGWHIQQVVKFSGVLRSDFRGTLVVDADTVLLQRKVFLSSRNAQILQLGQSYRRQYEAQFESFFATKKKTPMMFITHHQLMQKEVVQKMFPSPTSLLRWVNFSCLSDHFWLSEYDSYGSFLEGHFSGRVSYASWGNTKGSGGRELLVSGALERTLSDLSRHYSSASFHDHDQ